MEGGNRKHPTLESETAEGLRPSVDRSLWLVLLTYKVRQRLGFARWLIGAVPQYSSKAGVRGTQRSGVRYSLQPSNTDILSLTSTYRSTTQQLCPIKQLVGRRLGRRRRRKCTLLKLETPRSSLKRFNAIISRDGSYKFSTWGEEHCGPLEDILC